MRVDFDSMKTGPFSMEIPDDKNLFLLSGGSLPIKEKIESNIIDFYRHNGCEMGTRSISDVSFAESVCRIKSTIDTEGEKKALYNMYHYAEMSQASDLAIYNLSYDYSYLLDEIKEQETEEVEMC